MYVCNNVRMYVYVCMDVYMYFCAYVIIYVCIFIGKTSIFYLVMELFTMREEKRFDTRTCICIIIYIMYLSRVLYSHSDYHENDEIVLLQVPGYLYRDNPNMKIIFVVGSDYFIMIFFLKFSKCFSIHIIKCVIS